MAVTCTQITVPSNGTVATVFTSNPTNSSSISVRNTGTNTVLLGTTGEFFFPLQAMEFLGLSVALDDTLSAIVQTNGAAGQLTVLGVG